MDLMTLTEEAAKVSGIAYVMDVYMDVAEAVLAAGSHACQTPAPYSILNLRSAAIPPSA